MEYETKTNKPCRKHHYLNQDEYWESLSRSFTKEFIEEVRKEHDRRLQMA